MYTKLGVAVVASLCLSATSVARASSDDAWAAFRRDVEAACLAAVARVLEMPAPTSIRLEVPPMGSRSCTEKPRAVMSQRWSSASMTNDLERWR